MASLNPFVRSLPIWPSAVASPRAVAPIRLRQSLRCLGRGSPSVGNRLDPRDVGPTLGVQMRYGVAAKRKGSCKIGMGGLARAHFPKKQKKLVWEKGSPFRKWKKTGGK